VPTSGRPGTRGNLFRAVNALFALLFLASALLQYNDPDPLRWAALYGAAALACVLRRSTAGTIVAVATGGIALVWAASLAPRVLPVLRPGDLFGSMKAATPIIEESREMLGLLIVATWMVVLLAVRRSQRSGAASAASSSARSAGVSSGEK
jgi:hypothetical protein